MAFQRKPSSRATKPAPRKSEKVSFAKKYSEDLVRQVRIEISGDDPEKLTSDEFSAIVSRLEREKGRKLTP